MAPRKPPAAVPTARKAQGAGTGSASPSRPAQRSEDRGRKAGPHPQPLIPHPSTDTLASAKVLILSDGRAGHQNQSLGVAAALGHPEPEIITLAPRVRFSLLKALPLSLVFGPRPLAEIPHADVVVATGFQMGRVARWLKTRARRQHRPEPFIVQLMRPSGPLAAYDVVAIPQHDLKPGSALPANTVITAGAPNRVTKELLARETARWASRLAACPTPRLAVLIGGASKHGPFGETEAALLIKQIIAWARRSHGSLLISTSRRTAPPVRALIDQMLAAQSANQASVAYYLWHPDDPTRRDNPFLAYLGSCTAALVTVESVSMVSEAATAAKPVYLYGSTAHMPRKLKQFYATLQKQGRLAPWSGKLTQRIPREGLNDAALVAGFVRAVWSKRQA